MASRLVYLCLVLGGTTLTSCAVLQVKGAQPAVTETSAPSLAQSNGSTAPSVTNRAVNSGNPAPSIATDGSNPVAGSAIASTQLGFATRPLTKVVPLSIEGQAEQIELQLLDDRSLPFTTYLPAQEFQVAVTATALGKTTQFTFRPTATSGDQAFISVFLPTEKLSLEQVRELVLGDRGLLAQNQWQLGDRTDIVSYTWAREKLFYQYRSGQELRVGAIYIGETGTGETGTGEADTHQTDSQAFYVLTHYPAEYSDGFEPRSSIVLESLEFRQ